MWTLKKKICFAMYKAFAAWLPTGQRCKPAKVMRYHFAKHVCRLGENVNIERNAFFTPELTVGDNSGIGVNSEIYGPVTIGSDVMMGPEVVIYTHDHEFSRTDIPMRLQGSAPVKPVEIGDDCWIGRRVMIMPGVHIGSGCVIGAGAVVTKDIPGLSVAAGVPARVIKSRITENV